jgi:hypothetical protein
MNDVSGEILTVLGGIVLIIFVGVFVLFLIGFIITKIFEVDK